MVGKYNGEALATIEKIKGSINCYIENKVYKNTQYNIYWYINRSGYLHVLRPCKTTLNGKVLHYSIEDLLLTKDNKLSQKWVNGKYETIQKVIEELEQEVAA
jgi:hypothetical protein